MNTNVRDTTAQFFAYGREFFDALDAAIREARKEILISAYEFRNDAIGQRFIVALGGAAQKGVRVKVVFDNVELASSENETTATALSRVGVEAVVFRPLADWLPWHPLAASCRNHARLILIDREIFGLGGMSFSEPCREREDCAMLMRISDAENLVRYFDALWSLATTRKIPHALLPFPQRTIAEHPALLSSGPERRDQQLYAWLTKSIRAASQRIIIATPFFFPDRALLRELVRAKKRGVAVEVFTPAHSDKPRYDWFRAIPIPQLRRHHIVWRGVPTYFHEKLFIRDDQWTFGSANFDICGTRRNFELNVCGKGGAVLRYLEQRTNDLRARASQSITLEAPWHIRALLKTLRPLAEFVFKLT